MKTSSTDEDGKFKVTVSGDDFEQVMRMMKGIVEVYEACTKKPSPQ